MNNPRRPQGPPAQPTEPRHQPRPARGNPPTNSGANQRPHQGGVKESRWSQEPYERPVEPRKKTPAARDHIAEQRPPRNYVAPPSNAHGSVAPAETKTPRSLVPPGSSDPPFLATPADVLVTQVRDLTLWAWGLRWWLLIAILAGGFVGTGLAMTVLRKQLVTARISLLSAQLENPLGIFNRKSIRFFNSPLSAFTADSLVESTLRELDGKAPDARLLFEVKTGLQIVDYGSDNYEVFYRHQDGQRAEKLLEIHLRNYRVSEQERNLAALRREVTRLEGTRNELAKRMDDAENKLREFRTQNAYVRPEFAKENMTDLRRAQSILNEQLSKLADTEIELDKFKAQLAAEKPELRVATTTSESGDAERVARIDRLRMEISTLRASGLLDKHPTLERLLIEENALSRMDRPTTAVPTQTSEEVRPNERFLQLTQAVEKLEVLKEQLTRQIKSTEQWRDTAQQTIRELPLLEQKYAELSRDQDADTKSYQSTAQVLEMAKLQLRLEEEAAPTRLDVYSAPRLQFTSNLMRTAAMGIGGALAGFALVVTIWGCFRLRRLIWGGKFSRGNVN